MKSRSSNGTCIGASTTSSFHHIGEVFNPLLFLSSETNSLLILLELIRAEIIEHLVTNHGCLLPTLILPLLLELLLVDRCAA